VNISSPSNEQKIPALKGRQTITVGKAHCSRSREKQKALQGRNIFYFKAKICVIRVSTRISDSDKVEGVQSLPWMDLFSNFSFCFSCVATSYANPASSSMHREYFNSFE